MQYTIRTTPAELEIADSAQTEYCTTFHCPSVCSSVTGVTSHISHIYKGINAMLIIRGPIKPYIFWIKVILAIFLAKTRPHKTIFFALTYLTIDFDFLHDWLWIVKNRNAESAVFTLSCFYTSFALKWIVFWAEIYKILHDHRSWRSYGRTNIEYGYNCNTIRLLKKKNILLTLKLLFCINFIFTHKKVTVIQLLETPIFPFCLLLLCLKTVW